MKQQCINGQELSEVGASLEEIDAAWKQALTNGVKANVADDSRCYLQVGGETVARQPQFDHRGPPWDGESYRIGVYGLTKTIEAPTLQVDGKSITGEVGDLNDGIFGGGQEIWYQVPAASPQATFSADVKMAGALKPGSSNAKNAPASVEHIYQIRDINLEFAPQPKNG